MTSDEQKLLIAQCKLSKSLSLGFVLTFLPAFGFLSLIIGWQAFQKIETAQGKLGGDKLATWCLVVGLLETLWIMFVICMWLLNRQAPP